MQHSHHHLLGWFIDFHIHFCDSSTCEHCLRTSSLLFPVFFSLSLSLSLPLSPSLSLLLSFPLIPNAYIFACFVAVSMRSRNKNSYSMGKNERKIDRYRYIWIWHWQYARWWRVHTTKVALVFHSWHFCSMNSTPLEISQIDMTTLNSVSRFQIHILPGNANWTARFTLSIASAPFFFLPIVAAKLYYIL